MKRMCYRSCLAVLVVAFALNARAQTLGEAALPSIKENDRPAPVDYGFGPGVRPEKNRQAVQEMMMAAPAAAPVGNADAQTKGVFGPPVTWPLIGLHVVLLPDGRVMSYGTSEQGQQGAQFVYDVWNPTLGTDTTAHMVLPNTTGTDIFCSGQSVLSSGEVLITGGDLTINGKRNFSNQQTTVFHPQTNTRYGSSNRCCMRGGILPSFRSPTVISWFSAAVRTPAPPPDPGSLSTGNGLADAVGCHEQCGFRRSGVVFIPVRSLRPTAGSSCWATTARCSIWTRPGTARSLS